MLLVKANAGPSKIHQLGLVARQFIPVGTIVWRFQPGFDIEITEEQFKRLSHISQEQVIYYAFFDDDTKRFMLSSDDERLTNHSNDPNTRCRDDYTYAVRDIHEGEEITNDYREFNMLNFDPE